jgi:hypothetical protein
MIVLCRLEDVVLGPGEIEAMAAVGHRYPG